MRKLLFILSLSFILIQCKSKSPLTELTEPAPRLDAHNSRNSLDWFGMYSGILPCKDCMGKRTIIHLKEGLETEVTTIDLGEKMNMGNFVTDFSWDNDGNRISFTDQKNITHYFKVEENRLVFDGNSPDEAYATQNKFVLKKGGDRLLNRLWTADEIMGQSKRNNVEEEPTEMLEENQSLFQYLLLRTDGTFIASGGCNLLQGKYKLMEKNKLNFSNISMTEKACENAHLDNALVSALEQTEVFLVPTQEDENSQELKLHLMVGKRAPLAIFSTLNFPPQ
tara:strand:+ start:129 stop:968 length:840 start_codon:yes stop_codon:yes gene_type:complete